MRKEKNQIAYITKRLVVTQSRMAFKEKAQSAMALVGYTVVAEAGWIVKKTRDGQVTKLKEIDSIKASSRKLVLDK